jgi:tRNA (guanine-N7-)-methyltransferase
MKEGFSLKGYWHEDFFKNENPISLELGCGKGEYTVGLAERYPAKNFIGIDIKGARMWKGCKIAYENVIRNVAFIRSKIEFITNFFEKGEVSEIWLTFPDPQLKKERKRLSSPMFLERYRQILNEDHLIHLKTDSVDLFKYTLAMIENEGHELLYSNDDIYNKTAPDEVRSIRTFYEEKFLEKGMTIHYLKFKLKK